MSRGGLGRNDPCPCGSGKKYKKCCSPRTFPDFSKPNAGLPDPFEEHEATYRALARQEAQLPHDQNATIDTADVGRTRVLCAPLAPYGDGDTLPGTLAPPTPLQIETKYQEIREGNPEGVTEVIVEYTYPDLFGFAEVRAVFDADDYFRLVDGRVVSVLDLFRGMQAQMSRGRVGTIRGHPERRYDIPVAPLPDANGLWSSRVVGLVKHTAHEVVEFRWARQMVRVTPGHVVWSADRRGWVGAHELLPGEMIRVAGNVIAPVEGVRRVPGFIEVFGIEVEYFHNYFVGTGANAMLVHNGPEKVARPVSVLVHGATDGEKLSYLSIGRQLGPREMSRYIDDFLRTHFPDGEPVLLRNLRSDRAALSVVKTGDAAAFWKLNLPADTPDWVAAEELYHLVQKTQRFGVDGAKANFEFQMSANRALAKLETEGADATLAWARQSAANRLDVRNAVLSRLDELDAKNWVLNKSGLKQTYTTEEWVKIEEGMGKSLKGYERQRTALQGILNALEKPGQ
jgi:SEC-C motif